MHADQQQATIDLNSAHAALDQGNFHDADAICQRLMEHNPQSAPALHLSSLLRYREGKVVDAIAQMLFAIELEPNRALWLNDLGNLLAAHQQPDQAVKFFRHALMLEPQNAVIWNNLGAMRVKLDQQALAGAAFEQAVALDESLVDAWANYANWLTAQGRDHDAAECVLRAFVAAPGEGQPMLMRGMALARLGRPEEAARCFEAHLELNPNDPTALHLFHACAGDAVPERATDDYIRAKYDNYADSYDAQQRTLSYHAPFLIAGAVDARLGEGLTVLDAGCGTGLAAMGILPHCAHLTGVDLSDGMLAQASAKGVYQTLVNSEITHYLATHPAQFDLIVSADLLGYFGSLSPFFRQACGALRAGGYLVATLEAQDEQPDGFLLQANGRYHHGESYLSTCLSEAGFEQVSVRREWQRIEGDQRLPAWLVVAKRPAP